MAKNWQNRAEQQQFQDQAVLSCQHAFIIPCSFIALSSREKHFTTSTASHGSILAAIITQNISTEQCSSCFVPTFPSPKYTTPSPTALCSSKFLGKQSQVSKVLKSVPFATVPFKPSSTHTFSLVEAFSHHKVSTKSAKSSKPRKKNFLALPQTALAS